MDGFIIVNKEKGYTSHDVCFKLKKILKANKTGHSGTLDPNTTGVLVIGINNATKLMCLLNEHDKEYKATIMFGLATDTMDITGNIVGEEEVESLDLELLDKALKELKLQTKQIPPMYSSIKVNGKKLYEYARAKVNVEVAPRDIKVYDLKRLGDSYIVDKHLCIDVYLNVGKGYYVRSLVTDLAEKLKIKATMLNLDRISCGDFKRENSFSLEQITNNEYKILKIDEVFSSFKRIDVTDYMAKLVSNGVMMDERQLISEEPFLVYNQNKLIAVYEVIGINSYKPLLIIK